MKWVVWCPDRGDTREGGRVMQADDAFSAAEEWARRDDREPDKEAIRKAIEGGADVPGCSIGERGRSVRIK